MPPLRPGYVSLSASMSRNVPQMLAVSADTDVDRVALNREALIRSGKHSKDSAAVLMLHLFWDTL